MLAAPRVLAVWRRGRLARAALVVAIVAPAMGFFALATFARPLAAAMDAAEPDYDQVVRTIAAASGPDDRMFVWGNSPQLYVLSARAMGTRFSFCNYMTGESPGTATETGAKSADANSLPASWQMLFEDLDSRRPELFVDASAAGWDGYDKFPIARYPRLLDYLRVHYRHVATSADVQIYRRLP